MFSTGISLYISSRAVLPIMYETLNQLAIFDQVYIEVIFYPFY